MSPVTSLARRLVPGRAGRDDPQVVLISGGARGIGAALARAHRARGDTVVVADRDPLHDDDLVLDVRDRDAYRRLAQEVVATHGRIDIFYNNAGIGVAGVQEEMTPQHWQEQIDVNLLGVVHGVDAVYPLVCQQGHGRLVIMASLAGLLPIPAMIPYSSVKSAVVTLGRALRVEARRHGVQVNIVCPAFVATPLLTNINPGLPATGANEVGVRLVRQVQGGPMDPDRLAAVVLKALPKDPEMILAPWPTAHLAVLGERLVPAVGRRVSGLFLRRYLRLTAQAQEQSGEG
ncbi:SDR family NAD(P)-dependent oxidoreductase [Ornithinimicrobium pratense]|uniref:SDR family oxidoreductase n=1 Tax=Ornithinimicrobium pratense TaxID=2593973 RepID=A0A5J6V4T2_9MICO|nr:SDR family oxidoreductase [Ornithinimicrobium pratense]QFG68304.1 SDR family oxidoreductase [Ornithinimicrobium pratense]